MQLPSWLPAEQIVEYDKLRTGTEGYVELTKEEMQEWENLTTSNDANIEVEKNSFLTLLKEKQFFLTEAEEDAIIIASM